MILKPRFVMAANTATRVPKGTNSL